MRLEATNPLTTSRHVMSHSQLITATEITAVYRGPQKELVITARVTLRGGEEVRIVRSGFGAGPGAQDEFAVVGRLRPGIHPEDIIRNVLVEGVFSMAANPGTITVLSQGREGPTRNEVNVTLAPVVPVVSAATAAIPTTVIGWSKALDFEQALADAAAQLPRPPNPDVARAGTVSEIGVRIGGNISPTGLYVKLVAS